MPRRSDLPSSLWPMSSIQCAELRHVSFGTDADQLLRRLEELGSMGPAHTSQASDVPPSPWNLETSSAKRADSTQSPVRKPLLLRAQSAFAAARDAWLGREAERLRSNRDSGAADIALAPGVNDSLSIFADPHPERSYDRDSLLMNSKIIEKKLADFAIAGRVVRVHPSSVFTMYEYEPAAGVKVNKVATYRSDLALALRAPAIEILAPLPGKAVVGIRLPNDEREDIHLREILESKSFANVESKLSIAIGQDTIGVTQSLDLAELPGLLVAGATGTGKSTLLHAVLCTLLCRCAPDELGLVLLDPLGLDLGVYQEAPHVVGDVVRHPEEALGALGWVVSEIEERQSRLRDAGVGGLGEFNRALRSSRASRGAAAHSVKGDPMPFLVVVISELTPIVAKSKRTAEELLPQIAQMGREVGIHLLLFTQSTRTTVLTDAIRSSFPARACFHVASRKDSRTVLDQNGAEELLPFGDLLLRKPGAASLQRVLTPLVTSAQARSLVDLLRVRPTLEVALGPDEEHTDEDYVRAVEFASRRETITNGALQRELGIGNNRASRILREMEANGLVGPTRGSRGRLVTIHSPER